MKIRPDFPIFFAQLENGKWLAASNEEPFFCFEGDSEDEVTGIALRALDMFERSDPPAPVIRTSTVNVTRFSGAKVRKREDLLVSNHL
jgi:hypothetical protein